MIDGLFIVFDGIDGASKTTQVRLLTDALKAEGRHAVPTFEPTNSEVGIMLQTELHKSDKWRLPARALINLFVVDRMIHLKQVVLPNLRDGVTVVCDRYYFSTMVHQGMELSPDPQDFHRAVAYIEAQHKGFRKPDVTFFLDVPAEVALRRIEDRGGKRQCTERLEHLTRARTHYQQLAVALPDNIYLIDALGTAQEVHARVMAVLGQHDFHQPSHVL